MRRPGGYAITVEADGRVEEEDSITCLHCNAIVFVAGGADPSTLGGFCRLCMRHICAGCAASGKCDPFERKLLRMEARDRLRRALMNDGC